jgi:hypothetical protein
MVQETGQPYAYTGDDPVNAIDPNGLDCGLFSFACAAYDASAGGVKTAAVDTGHFVSDPSRWRAEASTWAGVGNFFVNFFQPNPGLGLPHANVANPYPCSDSAYYTFGNYLGAGLFAAGTAGAGFATAPEAIPAEGAGSAAEGGEAASPDIGHAGIHQFPGTEAGRSQFFDNVSLPELSDTSGDQGTLQTNGRIRYVLHAPQDIGVDRTTGLPTNIYTVIRGSDGNVVTMFPGTSPRS